MNIFVLNMSGYASYTILQRRVFEVILTVDYNFDGKLSSSLPLSLITTYFLSHSTHFLSHINYACLVPTVFSFDFGKSPLCPHLLFHFCIYFSFCSTSLLTLSLLTLSFYSTTLNCENKYCHIFSFFYFISKNLLLCIVFGLPLKSMLISQLYKSLICIVYSCSAQITVLVVYYKPLFIISTHIKSIAIFSSPNLPYIL